MRERFWLPPMVTEGRSREPFIPQRKDKGLPFLNTEVAISLLRSEQARKIFTDLLDRPEFGKKIKTAKKAFRQLAQDKVMDLKHSLVGSLFETVCFHFLQAKINPQDVLLSPQETFNLYKLSFPEKPTLSDYELNFGIPGITVPDGLVLSPNGQKTMITAVCEYTLTLPPFLSERQEKQIKYYSNPNNVLENLLPFGYSFRPKFLGDFLHQLHPELPAEVEAAGNFHLIYVTTQGNEKNPRLSNGRILAVPLFSREFGLVASGIFQDLGVGD